MQQISQRPDAKIEHRIFAAKFHQLSWDDLRVFLSCARLGSFRKSATELHMSSSTVVRRIERLETALGLRLFDRLPDGVALTSEGQNILESARNMENAVNDVARVHAGSDPLERGNVTISITEGIGTYWVMPHLVDFQRHEPQISVNLCCAMESADVLRLEADMAIQFTRPTSPNLIVAKLGRLHVHAFASQEYLNNYGTPHTPDDLANHKFVQQVAPQLDDSAMASGFNLESITDLVSIRTNTSTAHFYAVEMGAGIGVLPTFAVALKAPVVPLDIAQRHYLDIWLTFHPDIKKIPRKAKMIEWVKQIFDPKIYPWFRDEFIHPDVLAQELPQSASINVGDGYFSVNPGR